MRRVSTLTSLRFFAAFGVMLYHAGNVFFPGVGARSTFVGFTGVTFFFALSGFVLTWAWAGEPASNFYRRRFARVYPLHLLTWIVATVVGLATAAITFDLIPWLTGLTLLQAWIPSQRFSFAANGPAWSLSCEAFFYAVFPFIIRWAQKRELRTVVRGLAIFAGIYYLVVILTAVLGLRAGFTFLYINPAGRLIDFVAGITVCLAVKAQVRAPVRLDVAAGALLGLLIAGGAVNAAFAPPLFQDAYILDAVVLPFACLLIWSAATRGDTAFARLLGAAPLVRLGEWSFAMYLVQQSVLWILEGVGATSWPLAGRVGAEVLFLVGTIAVAAVAYYGWERPLERRLRPARPRPEEVAASVSPA